MVCLSIALLGRTEVQLLFEVLLFVVSVALWLAWTVWQFRNEGATIEKESQQLTSSLLHQILDRGR